MTARTKFHDARSNAKRRGIAFLLTYEQYEVFISSRCVYGSETANGVDRKDSAKPYTEDNSAPCCYRHNLIKGAIFSHEEMLHIIAACPSAVTCGSLPQRKRSAAPWKSLKKQGRAGEIGPAQAKAERTKRRTESRHES